MDESTPFIYSRVPPRIGRGLVFMRLVFAPFENLRFDEPLLILYRFMLFTSCLIIIIIFFFSFCKAWIDTFL